MQDSPLTITVTTAVWDEMKALDKQLNDTKAKIIPANLIYEATISSQRDEIVALKDALTQGGEYISINSMNGFKADAIREMFESTMLKDLIWLDDRTIRMCLQYADSLDDAGDQVEKEWRKGSS